MNTQWLHCGSDRRCGKKAAVKKVATRQMALPIPPEWGALCRLHVPHTVPHTSHDARHTGDAAREAAPVLTTLVLRSGPDSPVPAFWRPGPWLQRLAFVMSLLHARGSPTPTAPVLRLPRGEGACSSLNLPPLCILRRCFRNVWGWLGATLLSTNSQSHPGNWPLPNGHPRWADDQPIQDDAGREPSWS